MALPDTTVVHGLNAANLPPIAIGVAGSLIPALKAVLVDGWAETPVLSMTYDGATGLVTATFSEQHTFSHHQVIEVTGANETEYNGRWRIAEIPGTHDVKFEIGSVPSGDATGTITMKCGAAGWTMPYINVDETVAYFEPQHLRGGAFALRVEDDGVIGTYNIEEAIVDVVSSYSDDVTYSSHSSLTSYIKKGSTYTNYTNDPMNVGDSPMWAFVANPHIAYLRIRTHNHSSGINLNSYIYTFGYVASNRPTPDFMWCFSQSDADYPNETGHGTAWGYGTPYARRELSHNSSLASNRQHTLLEPENTHLGLYGEGQPFSGVLRYRFPVSLYVAAEEDDELNRAGQLPGIGNLLHKPSAVPDKTVFDTDDGTFLCLHHHSYYPYASDAGIYKYTGSTLFKIVGPWPTEE